MCHSAEGIFKKAELQVTTDEPVGEPVHWGLLRRRDTNESPSGNRAGFTLQWQGLDLLSGYLIPHEPVGAVTDQDLTWSGRLLESRGDVDRITSSGRAACPALPDDDFAGIDPDAHPKRYGEIPLKLIVQCAQGGLHIRGGTDRPKCIVFPDSRYSEQGYDSITDELLDSSLVTLDRRPHGVEITTSDIAQRFGI